MTRSNNPLYTATSVTPPIPPSYDRQPELKPLAIEPGNLEENDTPVSEESSRDVVKHHILSPYIPVKDLPLDEIIPADQGSDALRMLNQTAVLVTEDNGGDDNDDRTITRLTSQRPPSPISPGLTVVLNINHFTMNVSHSIVAVDSEVTGAAVNSHCGNEKNDRI